MHLTPAEKNGFGDALTVVKEPTGADGSTGRDEAVSTTVSSMLSRIEREGMDAVLHYARELDGFTGSSLEVPAAELARAGDGLPADLREALDTGADRSRRFAVMQRDRLVDFEEEVVPGVVCGQRFVPVDAVGAYLPAGRFPLLAGAFMTVGVAKAAGVPHVVAATPPSFEGRAHPAVLYSAHISGADAAYAVGGVQALAAMAFGLLDGRPADMVVGAGNAYVAEAKRQLFGRVGIDVLAGPSEVAVIADDTADAAIVAADLLAQAEHGPTSPASLVTTSERLAHEVVRQVEKQLAGLATAEIAGAAWRDHGSIYVVPDRVAAAEVMNLLAPEHLEVLAEDLDWWLGALRNYGSLFLGTWSTVAYADKGMSGTNHVLPTVRGARFTGGLSVAGFLKQLTHQRATRESTVSQAGPTVVVSDAEGLVGHRDSAQLRLDAVAPRSH
ncbi:histidinol dehydrogenase [Pseudonocardia sp. KRD-184]|uniref:Histidinol dehydrogenase n=1 Tax=Pseudonocardia oceani TaxID=2792013 RepID=A0ABS6U1P0_9PSEU|nr:histidinol dehydrogenase [Pseudonocardia oceani]MBW0089193.1 histidinol dehydrogenase [Pseudonocardia oceani]MBW0096139.1 histidinol dehydrogenase [Pseudonocardia oceani]MBW0108903.1 histidinol dehydrogenase [Pseudonocardia oceani]MBW0123025.1 histidinol dehydrogenase [Pseudonocardia oceani]MBW0126172.1 histidinol dehydrogenase [Pseudonocardia oceani]